MARRPLRTTLAVLGVAIGIFALVVMGAMSEHFTLLADHFTRTYLGRIFVCERLSFWAGGGIVSEAKVAVAARVAGVHDVIPTLISKLRDQEMVTIGLPQMIVGVPPDQARLLAGDPPLAAGRWLEAGDRRAAVVGHAVAVQEHLTAGGAITLRNRPFRVAGVLAHTGALEDQQVFVPLAAAQAVLNRPHLLTNIVIIPEPNRNLPALAADLRRAFPALQTLTPADLGAQVSQALAQWRLLTVGTGLLALVVGSLCIVITMVVAVRERTAEIGIKKVVGASTGQIVWEYLVESVATAWGGWKIGAVAGVAFVLLYESWLAGKGISLFTLTWRLVEGSLGWALLVGMLAGALPAWQAAQVDPVKALRRE